MEVFYFIFFSFHLKRRRLIGLGSFPLENYFFALARFSFFFLEKDLFVSDPLEGKQNKSQDRKSLHGLNVKLRSFSKPFLGHLHF